jgi:hypothetical protein
MTTFADALRMSAEDRVALGKKVLTARWWDSLKVRALSKQTWFSDLRRDLNHAGKVTFDLGLFKYERMNKAATLTNLPKPRLASLLSSSFLSQNLSLMLNFRSC